MNPNSTGLLSYEITNDNFVMGISTSDDTHDGGFSPLTNQVNLIISPGTACPPAPTVQISTQFPAVPIASCEDSTPGGYPSGNIRYVLQADTANVGYLTCVSSGSSVTSISVGGLSFVYGISDMANYPTLNGVNKVFITSATDITMWDGNTTVVINWWTVSNGILAQPSLKNNVPHPLCYSKGSLYIADGNLLHYYYYDALHNTHTIVNSVLTLPTNQVITALAEDPASGSLLVAVSSRADTSDSASVHSYVGYYDGANPTAFTKSIPSDDQISAFYNLGGTVFCFYALNIGYISGSGVKFLRRISSSYTATKLTYKCHVTNVANTLYIVTANGVLAYGEVLGGTNKVFYYALLNNNPSTIDFACTLGSGNLLVHDTTLQAFSTFNTYGVSTSSSFMYFYANKIHHQRPSTIRAIEIQLDQKAVNTQNFVYLLDDQQNLNPIGLIPQGQSFWRFNCELSYKTTMSQVFAFLRGACGIKKIVVYYDYAE